MLLLCQPKSAKGTVILRPTYFLTIEESQPYWLSRILQHFYQYLNVQSGIDSSRVKDILLGQNDKNVYLKSFKIKIFVQISTFFDSNFICNLLSNHL